jgi:hypothetical protein
VEEDKREGGWANRRKNQRGNRKDMEQSLCVFGGSVQAETKRPDDLKHRGEFRIAFGRQEVRGWSPILAGLYAFA